MKRLLIGLTALALCSACGSRVRNWPEEMAIVEQTTTTIGQSSSPTTSASSEEDTIDVASTTTRPNGPTTTVKSSLPHPAPGTYTYDFTFHVPAYEDEPASDESDSYDVTWAASGSDSALTLTETDDGDTVMTYRVTSGAFELQAVKYDDEEDVYQCSYAPAQTLLKLPLTKGSKWTSDSTCKFNDGEVDRVTLQSEVTGTTTDTIGGATVDTVVVQWTETSTEKYPDDEEVFVYKSLHIAHIDPKTLLVVSEELRDQSEDGIGATSTRKLRSLTPR